MIRWKLHRLFSGGSLVIIKPTMECNLDCKYCSNVIATGRRVGFPEVKPDDWIRYLKRFPTKIQVVSISGGEPQTYPYINELVEKLIENKYWVRLLTNMTLRNLNVKPNKRFCIQTSYHRQVDLDEFNSNLDYFKGHQIVMKKELTTNKIKGSKQFEVINETMEMVEGSKLRHRWFRSPHIKFVVAPNLALYTSCLECNMGRVNND